MELSKRPDRSKIYYKITNKEEIHHRLQYYDGLIIDPIKFNNSPKASCVKGGIYFTTKEYLHRYFCFGEHIRPITIPKGVLVLLDPEGDKYRADQLFFHPKQSMKFYFNKLFDKKTFPEKDYFCLARDCSEYFDKWFDKETFPKKDYGYLAQYCLEYFNIWFDKETFPQYYYVVLAAHCSKYFNIWFDKETFPQYYYVVLAVHCSKYFNIWFDKKTFPKIHYSVLKRYCPEHSNKWKEK